MRKWDGLSNKSTSIGRGRMLPSSGRLLSNPEIPTLYDWRALLYPMAYHALGRKKESDAALKELVAKYHEGGAYQIAQVYAFRNQSDEAFDWLDRAYAQRDSGLVGTKVDPFLNSLHNDPRYAAF